MLILSDIHIGVNRQGGTTPASREGLRQYLFTAFEDAMHTSETHTCILGDLFDQFEIEGRDWVQTYLVLSDYLSRPNGGFSNKLTLVAGNHDHSPKALRVSSFEMLCKVLVEQFGPERVHVIAIDQYDVVEEGVFALAHCSNQDIFDEKLKSLLDTFVQAGSRVLLHANYDNHFATNSDHSLNVSEEQAKSFADKGATLYFAHEHQARKALGGSVVVFGNQWPTSVADCLNNDIKYAHVLNGGVTQIATWARDLGDINEGAMAAEALGYGEIDWRNLDETGDPDMPPLFIKVIGKASSNEAGDCMSAIAKFRHMSKAFVITNGVKIEGVLDNEALPESFEVTKAFDVIEFINSNLDEPQRAAVKKLQEVVR